MQLVVIGYPGLYGRHIIQSLQGEEYKIDQLILLTLGQYHLKKNVIFNGKIIPVLKYHKKYIQEDSVVLLLETNPEITYTLKQTDHKIIALDETYICDKENEYQFDMIVYHISLVLKQFVALTKINRVTISTYESYNTSSAYAKEKFKQELNEYALGIPISNLEYTTHYVGNCLLKKEVFSTKQCLSKLYPDIYFILSRVLVPLENGTCIFLEIETEKGLSDKAIIQKIKENESLFYFYPNVLANYPTNLMVHDAKMHIANIESNDKSLSFWIVFNEEKRMAKAMQEQIKSQKL